MADLKGVGGELRAVVTIKRKATGKVEVFELVGHTTPEQHAALVEELKKEKADGSNP